MAKNARKRALRSSQADTEAPRLRSGMYGTGGRFGSGNGHSSERTDRATAAAPVHVAYRVTNADGSGLERHRGHKFSQARYESLRLGW